MHAGNDVRRSRTGSHDDHAGRSLDAGVALGRMDGPLLVAHQDVPHVGLIILQAVVHGHDLPAGIPEDGIHALRDEGFPERFGTGNHNARTAPLSAEVTILA